MFLKVPFTGWSDDVAPNLRHLEEEEKYSEESNDDGFDGNAAHIRVFVADLHLKVNEYLLAMDVALIKS